MLNGAFLSGESVWRSFWLIQALLCLFTTSVYAQEDFGFDNAQWNGLTRLQELAATESIPIFLADRIDLEELGPQDSLLVVHPNELPIKSCIRLLKGGARVVLADDFGGGGELLSTYQIARSAPDLTHVPKLRNNPALAVAESTGEHPLNQGVSMLVTNHPASIKHASLAPLFSFLSEGAPQAVVITGAVNEGRLIAISDPSIFVNNMLTYRGNERFTVNLLHYLHAGGRRVVVINGSTKVTGLYGRPGADVERNLATMLRRFSEAVIPPAVMVLGSVLMLALMVFLSVSSLPKRSPYRISEMAPLKEWLKLAPKQLLGSVHASDLSLPAERYRIEFRSALNRVLGRDLSLDESLDQLASDGAISAKLAMTAKGQIQTLRSVSTKISPITLRQMVDTGELIIKHAQAWRRGSGDKK